jgi:Peptidase M50B-like
VTPAPSSLQEAVSRIGQTQPPLPTAVSVLIAIAALAAVGVQEIWLVTRHVNTLAHEGAHAIVGSALGRKVQGVRLRPNAEGDTKTAGGKVPGSVTVGVAGYLGPSAFGLIAAKMIQLGHSVAVLWLTLILLGVLLLAVRNAFGFVPVLATGGLIYIVARYGSPGADTILSYGVAWFLLLAGVRVVADHGVNAGDAGKLSDLTRIRPGFWVWLWLILTIGALGLGGSLLL